MAERDKTLYLAPESRLGQDAMKYWARKTVFTKPTYMRLTGDGCVAFGWREDLPYHTQQPHFVDEDGTKYDCGENKVSIHEILGV